MLPILTSVGVWFYLPTLCLPDLIARANFWLMLSVVLPFFPILLPNSRKGPVKIKEKRLMTPWGRPTICTPLTLFDDFLIIIKAHTSSFLLFITLFINKHTESLGTAYLFFPYHTILMYKMKPKYNYRNTIIK